MENLIKVLKDGGIAVMPTDTIYGIVGLAQSSETVERIYNVRKRSPLKPCIVLIGDVSDLEKFSIDLSLEQKNELKKYWPGPNSIIFDCKDEKFLYLHRGTNTLSFRLPAQAELQNLLKQTGPLIAPSANIEGALPAKNILEAREYFGDSVDLYMDGGELIGKPSKVIKMDVHGLVTILRA